MPARTVIRIMILTLPLASLLTGGYNRISAENHTASSAEGETHKIGSGISLYVATDGNDTWSGTLPQPNSAGTDGPLASVTAARDEIRKIKSNRIIEGPVTVYLRGGTYELQRALIFTAQDSGGHDSPRIYKAYNNEIPVLSGGSEIKGWKQVLRPADLPVGGLGAPPLQDNLWMAQLPRSEGQDWDFHELFIDGTRRQRARTPNQGFLLAERQISADDPARLHFAGSDIDPAWRSEGTEVGVLLHWGGFRLLLKEVDTSAHIATLAARRQPWGNDEHPRYWLENFPQALDSPGEWYLDRSQGTVYYHALAGEDMAHVTAIVARLPQLIRLVGEAEAEKEDSLVHNVSFQGLTLSYTDWTNASTGWVHSFTPWSKPEDGHIDEQGVIDVPAAFEAVGTALISVDGCTFSHLGGYAVEFHGGSKNDRLTDSAMTDLGAGGVKIGDGKSPSFDAQATTGNVVSDNRIHDIGAVYPTGLGVWIGESSGNTIAHNEIYDTFYSGISVGWTWSYGPTWARDNIVEFNDIYNIGRGMLSDLGCIYTVGVQPGTVIRNNVCHDVSRYEHGYGGWGIYTDEASSDIVIENNVVYRTVDGGFHQNYGRDNIVRNNIFPLGENAQIQRSHDEDHNSFIFEHNIFYWNDSELLVGKWDDGHFKFDKNLYFRLRGGPFDFSGKSLPDWRKQGLDVHSLVASPLFVDPEAGNFSLQVGSPALKIGFTPIDVSNVGPRKIH